MISLEITCLALGCRVWSSSGSSGSESAGPGQALLVPLGGAGKDLGLPVLCHFPNGQPYVSQNFLSFVGQKGALLSSTLLSPSHLHFLVMSGCLHYTNGTCQQYTAHISSSCQFQASLILYSPSKPLDHLVVRVHWWASRALPPSKFQLHCALRRTSGAASKTTFPCSFSQCTSVFPTV